MVLLQVRRSLQLPNSPTPQTLYSELGKQLETLTSGDKLSGSQRTRYSADIQDQIEQLGTLLTDLEPLFEDPDEPLDEEA